MGVVDWWELSIEADPETVDAVAEVLQCYGGRGVVVEERDPDEGHIKVLVKAYLPMDETLANKRSQIDLGLRLLALIRPMEPLQERRLSEEDWATAWRKHFHVLHIGQRIVICPTWLEFSSTPGDVVVRLDPGMAFGTGLHPTTRMCLELLERFARPGMHVLDLGTGTGILAIAAAKLGAAKVMALDIDPVAVGIARENFSLNGVQTRVICKKDTISGADTVPTPAYDLIVANITAKTLSEVAPAIMPLLKPQGFIIASGLLGQQCHEVEECFSRLGTPVREAVDIDEWRTLIFEKAVHQ